MNKAVMLSVRPKWCEKIVNGEKTIEVRKTRPKLAPPFKAYIYCTMPKYPHEDFIATNYPMPQFYGGGKVIGEFTCDEINRVNICGFWDDSGKQLDNRLKETCLISKEFLDYLGEKVGYGWHITDLRIYDAPRDLSEFWRDCPEYSELSTNCWACENVCGDGDETDCNTDGRRYLRRAPQSWCYVEEG